MINIKRLFFVSSFFLCFLSVSILQAQKINQFDANKKRTGVWRKYYPNKKLRYTGQFKDGKEVGTFKFYNIKNSKFPDIIKVFQHNSDSVLVSYYYPNQKLKGKGMMLGRKKVGKWNYYFNNGKKFSEETYKEGKLDGVFLVYYKKTGKIAEKSEYIGGKLHGNSKIYADNGVLIEAVTYRNGLPNGWATYYDLQGKLKEKGQYKNGVRIGKWEYYLDGKLVTKKKKKEQLKNKIQNK
ncbi:MAG: toxin-antitoxin system YwqK family antitoxin [Flavobacteriaceae bacterium]|nr:toxin-antitoxin system YwqK family antitoxin [Flavobacteriaceae bacterium]